MKRLEENVYNIEDILNGLFEIQPTGLTMPGYIGPIIGNRMYPTDGFRCLSISPEVNRKYAINF